MGVWEQFPYTNFHQENLDWVYSSVKNLDERVDALEQGGGGATKQYVDEQDGKLTAEIARVEKECNTNTTNISRDLNTESENRQAADSLLEGEIQSISSTVTNINDELGDWTQQGTISSAIASVQATAGNSATAIHGTGGTYDMSKGTIQARLNSLESSGGGDLDVTTTPINSLVKIYTYTGPSSTTIASASEVVSFSGPLVVPVGDFDRAHILYNVSVFDQQSQYSPLIFQLVQHAWSGTNCFMDLLMCNTSESAITLNRADITLTIYGVSSTTVVTSVSGGGGGSSDVTKSYVDSQDAELDAKITAAQTTADSAVTLATEASDSASAAVGTANSAITTANVAKNAADNAKSAADGATETAATANNNATTALTAIGAKSTAVTFSNLWATIGAWNESATITSRLKDAYNWSWNNRSAINGSADYPTDKGTINARLTELEENGGGSTQSYKLLSGTGEVGARTGEDLTVTFSTAFSSTPAVVASYCKTGDNDTDISGIVKVHHVTTTGCVISITGGAVGHMYSVSWIATGT